MPVFEPANLTLETNQSLHSLPDTAWLPILQHPCDFPPQIFKDVNINLIRNPNINSNLLFRADIIYDSLETEIEDRPQAEMSRLQGLLQKFGTRDGDFTGFEVERTMIRLMIPRNPTLDKPIAQTCQILRSVRADGLEQTLVAYTPEASSIDELPWYHPRVQSLAYLHSWPPLPSTPPEVLGGKESSYNRGSIVLYYRLFPSELLPLSQRLLRTGHHLLSTLHRHGQGSLAGYTKRVHHDQLIPQQRVQDTYTELKKKHAKRLCDNWVENTEPSKHVFEDLGIAAFLIELWKDIYGDVEVEDDEARFPGFVDIGCGNGVLTDVLLREGYKGWGLDARRRKTWATFDPDIQAHLKPLILIPQPLFELHTDSKHANGGILSPTLSSDLLSASNGTDGEPLWHNGIFPAGTFIISNHADELTPWTPLLASISSSPFLAIPCCSHNLSGLRFRAPSTFNSHSADALAPSYFAPHITKSKHVPITIAGTSIDDQQPSTGDLKSLSIKARAKQPSAYSSLCDWVSHLASEVGYEVEREMLRIPSTRNVGIVGRNLKPTSKNETWESKTDRVRRIASKEKADGAVWVDRARALMSTKGARIEQYKHIGKSSLLR